MQSELIRKDKISRSRVVAEARLTWILKKRRRHMNGRNMDSVGPSPS